MSLTMEQSHILLMAVRAKAMEFTPDVGGIAIGRLDDPATWRVSFGPSVSEADAAAYLAAIRAHDFFAPTADDVNNERDRRLKLFTFANKDYDFDADSQQNIAGAYSLALAAVINGAQPNDLKWIDSDQDFAWIAHDNSLVTMDAQTCLAFGQAAASWKADHIRAARSIKDLAPIPIDYAEDSRWPTA